MSLPACGSMSLQISRRSKGAVLKHTYIQTKWLPPPKANATNVKKFRLWSAELQPCESLLQSECCGAIWACVDNIQRLTMQAATWKYVWHCRRHKISYAWVAVRWCSQMNGTQREVGNEVWIAARDQRAEILGCHKHLLYIKIYSSSKIISCTQKAFCLYKKQACLQTQLNGHRLHLHPSETAVACHTSLLQSPLFWRLPWPMKVGALLGHLHCSAQCQRTAPSIPRCPECVLRYPSSRTHVCLNLNLNIPTK